MTHTSRSNLPPLPYTLLNKHGIRKFKNQIFEVSKTQKPELKFSDRTIHKFHTETPMIDFISKLELDSSSMPWSIWKYKKNTHTHTHTISNKYQNSARTENRPYRASAMKESQVKMITMNNRRSNKKKQSNKANKNTTSKCGKKRQNMIVKTPATEENITEKLAKTGESRISIRPSLLTHGDQRIRATTTTRTQYRYNTAEQNIQRAMVGFHRGPSRLLRRQWRRRVSAILYKLSPKIK